MDLRSLRITCQNVSWLIICKQLKGRYIQHGLAPLHIVAEIMQESKYLLISQSVNQSVQLRVVRCFVLQEVSLDPLHSYLPSIIHQHALVLVAAVPSSSGVSALQHERTCPCILAWGPSVKCSGATWLAILWGYYCFLQSKPFSTRLEKWDLNSGELQGHSSVLNSSIRLCQRKRNCRTKGKSVSSLNSLTHTYSG